MGAGMSAAIHYLDDYRRLAARPSCELFAAAQDARALARCWPDGSYLRRMYGDEARELDWLGDRVLRDELAETIRRNAR
jgi:hypothetical protein